MTAVLSDVGHSQRKVQQTQAVLHHAFPSYMWSFSFGYKPRGISELWHLQKYWKIFGNLMVMLSSWVYRESPSECITGILTAHCFLICLCAFMGFYVKCKLRLGSQIHGKDKMQINIPKWTITLFLSPYTCYRCQRMSITVSASLDFGFFSP